MINLWYDMIFPENHVPGITQMRVTRSFFQGKCSRCLNIQKTWFYIFFSWRKWKIIDATKATYIKNKIDIIINHIGHCCIRLWMYFFCIIRNKFDVIALDSRCILRFWWEITVWRCLSRERFCFWQALFWRMFRIFWNGINGQLLIPVFNYGDS